jgi:hypothetical protein
MKDNFPGSISYIYICTYTLLYHTSKGDKLGAKHNLLVELFVRRSSLSAKAVTSAKAIDQPRPFISRNHLSGISGHPWVKMLRRTVSADVDMPVGSIRFLK